MPAVLGLAARPILIDRLWIVSGRSDSRITKPAFHPDGQSVLIAGETSVRRWATGSGIAVGPRQVYPDRVALVDYSPDGKITMAAYSGTNGRGLILDEVAPQTSGDAARVTSWVETITGMELNRGNAISILDLPTWEERRRQLDRPAGSPPRIDRMAM